MHHQQFKFDLGSQAKDTITGFVGVITARCEYLHGTNRYGVQPTALRDGAPQDERWFDESQLRPYQP